MSYGGPTGSGFSSGPNYVGAINAFTSGLRGYLSGRQMAVQRQMAQAMAQRNAMLADSLIQHRQNLDDTAATRTTDRYDPDSPYNQMVTGRGTAKTAATGLSQQRDGFKSGFQFLMNRPPEERPALFSVMARLYPDAAGEFLSGRGAPIGASPDGSTAAQPSPSTGSGDTPAAMGGALPAGANGNDAPTSPPSQQPGMQGMQSLAGVGSAGAAAAAGAAADAANNPIPFFNLPSGATSGGPDTALVPAVPVAPSALALPSPAAMQSSPPPQPSQQQRAAPSTAIAGIAGIAGGSTGANGGPAIAPPSSAPASGDAINSLLNAPLQPKPMTAAQKAQSQAAFRRSIPNERAMMALMPSGDMHQHALDLNDQAASLGLPPVFPNVPYAPSGQVRVMPIQNPVPGGPTTKQFPILNPGVPLTPQQQSAMAVAGENNARAALETPKFNETVRHNTATETTAQQRANDEASYQQGQLKLGADRNSLQSDRLAWEKQAKTLGSPMEVQRFVASRNGDIARYRDAEQKLKPVAVIGIDHNQNSPTYGQRITIQPTQDQIDRYQGTAAALEQNIQNAAQLRDDMIQKHGLQPVPSARLKPPPMQVPGFGSVPAPSNFDQGGSGSGVGGGLSGATSFAAPGASSGAPVLPAAVTLPTATPGSPRPVRLAPPTPRAARAVQTGGQSPAPVKKGNAGGIGYKFRTPAMKMVPGTTIKTRSGKTALTILGPG